MILKLLHYVKAWAIFFREAIHRYKVERCGHIGAREWTTYDYHETLGAPALECLRCGLYWDATYGSCPGGRDRIDAFRVAMAAPVPRAMLSALDGDESF